MLLTVLDELLGSFFALGLGGMVMSGVFCIAGCVGIWTVVGALTCCKKCCVKCCCCWPCCKKCKGLFSSLKTLFRSKFLINAKSEVTYGPRIMKLSRNLFTAFKYYYSITFQIKIKSVSFHDVVNAYKVSVDDPKVLKNY